MANGCKMDCKRCDDMYHWLEKLDNRVSSKVSWWMMVVLIGIFTSLLGVNYAQTVSAKNQTINTNERLIELQSDIKHLTRDNQKPNVQYNKQ